MTAQNEGVQLDHLSQQKNRDYAMSRGKHQTHNRIKEYPPRAVKPSVQVSLGFITCCSVDIGGER